jgi:hypothetical protein
MKFLRQRLKAGRPDGKVAKPVLDEHNGNPARAGEREQHHDRGEPHRIEAVAQQQHQGGAADRLQQHRRRGEQPVGDDHVARRYANGVEVPAAVGHQQKKSSSHPGAEQQHGAQNVDQLRDFVGRHVTRIPHVIARSQVASPNSSSVIIP